MLFKRVQEASQRFFLGASRCADARVFHGTRDELSQLVLLDDNLEPHAPLLRRDPRLPGNAQKQHGQQRPCQERFDVDPACLATKLQRHGRILNFLRSGIQIARAPRSQNHSGALLRLEEAKG